ncbi:50S ribosomal protein L4 [Adhaeribacter pallidiroseus]|uniref:Large ribosomal subunit protein uL4 n=1 Tax=Adhaeribacter pallidiroseus TaxID=2072847 RepID=A0A369QK44_9BACT|nr:50S ribosomal protein L4 [Adhaeribacter pallidiroseus]RDC64762.1 50S ribosomal protein L4 [Adhaeribacter pallidiroseus]
MELSVLNINGQDTGRKVTLSDEIFGIEPNNHVMYLDVKQYLANKRQGTHKSKERNEVSGTTKKLKKQKGTGGARAGSMKSPVFIGGGRVFGPRPRDYSFKLNKKVKSLARLSALSTLMRDKKIALVEPISMAQPKTKEFKSILSNLPLPGKKTLVVTSEANENVFLSSRNLSQVKVSTAASLTTYDLLNTDQLLLTEDTVSVLEQIYKR